MSEEIDRTSPMALYNTAESYWKAAAALASAKVKSTHPDNPISFLYYHAIELYLKAFLRTYGHTVQDIASKKFGHSTGKMTKRIEALGIGFRGNVAGVLFKLAKTDIVIRSRYVVTGAVLQGYLPSQKELERTCRHIRMRIGKAMQKEGHPVRL